MQGAALATVGHIDTNNPPSYNDLMQTLNKRFSPPNQSEMYMTQIDARIRRRGESLPELAQDIKRLVRLANPTAPLDVQDNLAYRAFRNALNDQELEWAIVQTSTDTIDEALHLALKYEAYHLSRKRPSLRYQTNEPNTKSSKTSYTKEQDDQSNLCYYCHKPGHIAKKCRKRLFDQKNVLNDVQNLNYSQRQSLEDPEN
ncbi:Hypothetical predicted protein [Mytilus galloprovincialis]|uniref:CCHC-type domain-containing protein n=1 Tax=Mytilus galloprovincialis TaxID=29158 RepID=A0A8B6DS54_MYTGA|nr:Hypothetical predicted protein [Mytilus galloprovincialis]